MCLDDSGANGTKANELLKKSADCKVIQNKSDNCNRLAPPSSNVGNTLLPPPHVLGSGNPFLIFMCLSLLLQHRDIIINRGFDYNEVQISVIFYNCFSIVTYILSMFSSWQCILTVI